MQDLNDKTAFVTGAASGIGRAIATSLAREGVAVAVADIDTDVASRTAAEIEAAGGRALGVACDVTSEDSLERAADAATDALGPIQLLVNNAGAFSASPIEQTRRRDWEWLLEINVLGVVNGLHTFLPRMRAHGRASHIVNTASVSGHIPAPHLSIYTASKFAVVGLSEVLRLELADSPIDVSVLCPGIVKTDLLETSRRHRPEKHGGSEAGTGVEMSAVVETGTDPAEIGGQVVDGIRAGDFYIFTHPGVRPALERRFQSILREYRA
jgi:NAD(P)-dependent dehydrogenase (short-subunit alcohol dehydrogenase family)